MKFSLIINDMILYIEKPEDATGGTKKKKKQKTVRTKNQS